MASSAWNFTISEDELEKTITTAYETALSSATTYEHESVSEWNSKIITSVLNALTTSLPAASKQKYKFNVTSTIIQHDSNARKNGEEFSQNAARGMHSASGAFWDNSTDGIWSLKLDGQGKKEFDCVVSVLWIAMPGQ